MMLRLPSMLRAEPVVGPLAGPADSSESRERDESTGFRLVQPPVKLAPVATGIGMPRQFTATILLEESCELDVEAIAATVAMRFPTIGRIEVLPGPSGSAGAAVALDGARVSLQRLPGRVPPERFAPPLKVLRSWDPEDAICRHAGAIEITCGGELPGLEGAEAYAAAVHFVATAACSAAPACAVLWREGWTVSEPGAFAGSAEHILSGRMPLGAWVSFGTIVPRGFAPEEATGMVTFGMRPFIGREIELAPRPGSARDAWRCVSRIARMALDRGLALEDGQHLADPKGAFAVTVRERNFRLRRDQSAYVLVAEDSVVDVQTLKPRTEVA